MKKLFVLALVLLLAGCAASVVNPCDVNGDGAIDISDVLTIRAHINGDYSISNGAGDANMDGVIDETDISVIEFIIVSGGGV